VLLGLTVQKRIFCSLVFHKVKGRSEGSRSEWKAMYRSAEKSIKQQLLQANMIAHKNDSTCYISTQSHPLIFQMSLSEKALQKSGTMLQMFGFPHDILWNICRKCQDCSACEDGL